VADEEYCTVEDVYRYAVLAGALARRALLVAAIDATANTIEVAGHGCTTDDPIEFRVFEGGTLAAPLSAAAVYYAKPVADSDSLLQVAATAAGSAIDLTTAGDSFGLVPSIRPILRGQIRAVSRWIDGRLPAHVVPLEPDDAGHYPEVVRQMVATLAAECTLVVLGESDAALSASADRMRADARLLLSGIPLRDPKATAHTPFARGVSPTGNGRFATDDPKVIP
jgi:hypothetical protein